MSSFIKHELELVRRRQRSKEVGKEISGPENSVDEKIY